MGEDVVGGYFGEESVVGAVVEGGFVGAVVAAGDDDGFFVEEGGEKDGEEGFEVGEPGVDEVCCWEGGEELVNEAWKGFEGVVVLCEAEVGGGVVCGNGVVVVVDEGGVGVADEKDAGCGVVWCGGH